MKTIDMKSLLLGVLATSLVLTLTSGKISENEDNIDFVASPSGVGIFNKGTRTLYMYRIGYGAASINQKPDHIYAVAEDGSGLTKKQ